MQSKLSTTPANSTFWLLLLLTNALAIALLPGLDAVQLGAENSLLENLQAFLLASATLLFATASVRTGKTRQLTFLTTALLCFSFLLRELDLGDLAGLSLLLAITEGPGRDILLGTLWSLMALVMLRSGHSLRSLLQEARDNSLLVSGMLCFLLLLVGGVFDRGLVEAIYSTTLEELAETNAYLMLTIPAFTRSPSISAGEDAEAATDSLHSG